MCESVRWLEHQTLELARVTKHFAQLSLVVIVSYFFNALYWGLISFVPDSLVSPSQHDKTD